MRNTKNLLYLSEISKQDIALVGGKAASLGELLKIGISVPSGFVVSTNCYRQFVDHHITVDVKKEILGAFDTLTCERVAVRSSAIAEDSQNASWAGQLDTFLNVNNDNLIDAIQKCWKSVQSKRALSYAEKNDTHGSELAVGVAVQKMIDSEISGVMFTVNPITKDANEIIIDASFGLGELIVQGEITPDTFLIDKKNLLIKESNIQSKETMLVFQDGENKKISVSTNERNKSSLTSDQIFELASLGITIENHYKMPQDIEWAIDSLGKIWILQSRPITTL